MHVELDNSFLSYEYVHNLNRIFYEYIFFEHITIKNNVEFN